MQFYAVFFTLLMNLNVNAKMLFKLLHIVCTARTLKGQSNEIVDLQFFYHLKLARPLTNGLKLLRFWLRFGRVIQI